MPVATEDQQVSVEKLHMHELYLEAPPSTDPTSLGQDNDIAVLTLTQQVTTQAATPILSASRVHQTLTENATLVVSGYGINNLDTGTGGKLHVGAVPFDRMNQHEMILGKAGNTTDTCNGDSGGPAYLEVNNERFLVGVTSRAVQNGELLCGDGGIYTLAPSYIAWIAEKAPGLYPGNVKPPIAGPAIPGNSGYNESGTPKQPGDSDGAAEPNKRPDSKPEPVTPPETSGPGTTKEDECEKNDKYDDGTCDEQCAQPDPDCTSSDSPTSVEDALANQNTEGAAGFGEAIVLDATANSSKQRTGSSSGCAVVSGSPTGGIPGLLLLAIAALLALSRKSEPRPCA